MFGKSRLHDNLCSVVRRCPPHCFLVLFSQASSSTRKARSCTGSNEPFSHIDQPLPDPISPWTCSAIEAACPLYPPHTLHPHLPTPFSLCSWPPLPVYSLPGRRVCAMEIKQSGETEKEGESVTVYNLCCCSLCSCLTLSLLPLPVQHRPWQGASRGDLFGLRKTGSPQTFAKDREIEG